MFMYLCNDWLTLRLRLTNVRAKVITMTAVELVILKLINLGQATPTIFNKSVWWKLLIKTGCQFSKYIHWISLDGQWMTNDTDSLDGASVYALILLWI